MSEQGPKIHSIYSKPPSGTEIHNNRPMVLSRGHVWLFDASFLALVGYKIILVYNIHVSSHIHAQHFDTHT